MTFVIRISLLIGAKSRPSSAPASMANNPLDNHDKPASPPIECKLLIINNKAHAHGGGGRQFAFPD